MSEKESLKPLPGSERVQVGEAAGGGGGGVEGNSVFSATAPGDASTLKDMKSVSSGTADAALHTVALVGDSGSGKPGDLSNDPTAAARDRIAEMITRSQSSPGENFGQLKVENPALAEQIAKVVESMSSDPSSMEHELQIMGKIYATLDGRPGYNKETLDAMHADKLRPEALTNIEQMARDWNKLDPTQLQHKLKEKEKQVTDFYTL